MVLQGREQPEGVAAADEDRVRARDGGDLVVVLVRRRQAPASVNRSPSVAPPNRARPQSGR